MYDYRKSTISIDTSLEDWFFNAEKVVIAGIGNPFRRDDFVGVEIVRKLKNRISKSVYLIEAETIPESYMHQITQFKPSHILLIDAGLIKKPPGTYQIFESSKLMRKTSISTHTLPLRIFCDYLVKTTNAKIAILIIQPKDTTFGEGLTPSLKQSVKKLVNLLQKLFP
ncbi:hydrogenase 3 maturation endopeptidase HyCI [Candidatus Bathyarchaeota archaeon]|nr:hydrogenase 3 maturation endopeptidase HyCI [Candidatus Bathyarchaeota archaeon]